MIKKIIEYNYFCNIQYEREKLFIQKEYNIFNNKINKKSFYQKVRNNN